MRASPATYVSAAAPPSLLFHGDQDCWIPTNQSGRLHALLSAAGADSTSVVLAGRAHNDALAALEEDAAAGIDVATGEGE